MDSTTIRADKVKLLESDIEDWIFENPESVCINNILIVDYWIKRQYRVPSGIIDLFGAYGNEFVVVEIKNTSIESSALTQVCRYANDIRQISARLNIKNKSRIHKVVIGNNRPSNTIMYEATALNVNLLTFEVDLNLRTQNWCWTDEFLKTTMETYDELAEDDCFIDFVDSEDTSSSDKFVDSIESRLLEQEDSGAEE